jgi:hypothetical protein
MPRPLCGGGLGDYLKEKWFNIQKYFIAAYSGR